jgi:hypothetical protein
MITCFSFKLNGWVNYRFPNHPTPATIARGRAIAFVRDGTAGFGYADKEHAERQVLPHPAIAAKPFAWAKHMPKQRNEE